MQTVVLPVYTRNLVEQLKSDGFVEFTPGCDAGKKAIDVFTLVNEGLAMIDGDRLIWLNYPIEIRFEE
jgi:hypothetical protein